MSKTRALIIGAGPAGLTAAYEFVTRTGVQPVVYEKSEYIGGISRTVRYKDNRIDIGGHRFFSKSDRVMNWWRHIMNVQASADITYHGQTTHVDASHETADPDRVMLIRNRRSRIYFLRRFFDYPISLTAATLRNLGLLRTLKIGVSYMAAMAHQIKPETTLEQFLINRFGRELYLTFFKSYTEKVWGVPCHEISAEWGAQRIKGLSITKAILHFLKKKPSSDIAQKGTETSLIEKFMYPRYGPGQLWEYVAKDVQRQGGVVEMGWDVVRLHVEGNRIRSAEMVHRESGERRTEEADYFFSTMPVKELIHKLATDVPPNVVEVADGLIYRDFITVGLLLNRLKIGELQDNWIYIQEPDVQVGRMQIFNNWSPYLVGDTSKAWIGLEYFCYETDAIWKLSDPDMIDLAKAELSKIGIIDQADILDACVIRMPKTYPAYFGAYDRFSEIRSYVDGIENLFLVGRNGMHKYNNQDHSMLTAMTAVDNISASRIDKSNIWAINTEMEFHEEKK